MNKNVVGLKILLEGSEPIICEASEQQLRDFVRWWKGAEAPGVFEGACTLPDGRVWTWGVARAKVTGYHTFYRVDRAVEQQTPSPFGIPNYFVGPGRSGI